MKRNKVHTKKVLRQVPMRQGKGVMDWIREKPGELGVDETEVVGRQMGLKGYEVTLWKADWGA